MPPRPYLLPDVGLGWDWALLRRDTDAVPWRCERRRLRRDLLEVDPRPDCLLGDDRTDSNSFMKCLNDPFMLYSSTKSDFAPSSNTLRLNLLAPSGPRRTTCRAMRIDLNSRYSRLSHFFRMWWDVSPAARSRIATLSKSDVMRRQIFANSCLENAGNWFFPVNGCVQ